MAPPTPTSPPPELKLADRWSRLVHIYNKEIWQSAYLKDRSPRGCTYAVLRVFSITFTAFFEARVATRAAALSFSSMLGLAPLLAIATLVAGFALEQNDPKQIATSLTDLLKTIVPQIQQYESAIAEADDQAPSLVEFFSKIISSSIAASKSGSAGTFGALTLVFIVLLLFKSIEDTFNDIWGVRQGRSLMTRVVFYWTILTLGAVLFFTVIGLLFATTIASVSDKAQAAATEPNLLRSFGWALPIITFVALASILSLFYRVIPNTRVFWRAAFIGGLVVAALLMLNQFFAFLYVQRVALERNLYGGLALPLVLMSSLYVFWLCVLIGAIVSYAIQNVHYRNSQAAWSTLSESMRERLALVVFLTICRRFRECMPPISASHLSTMLKVPTQLLNECLNRLVQLKLVTTLRAAEADNVGDHVYQPSRPLNRLTLYDFKMLDDNFGENPISASFEQIDPLLVHYETALKRLGEQEFFQKTIEDLFDGHPFDESRPPFAMGERRPMVARPKA